uniref:Cytochrome c oxidase subunit 2 n=1 Tax=Aureoumbra lagunensis TaxID=44058 RepID=A0A7U0QG81_9STRA|nr:cytochrome c oxidase subunit 2 [Aureoumbra lagunensis]QQW50395.1 cytochrome c oxidase subunit 2 [Aureoumbra lagunensis]
MILKKLTSLLFFIIPFYCLSDSARPWQMNFQDPATPVMEGIINFHNHIMFFLIMVVIFVSWMLFRCLFYFSENMQNVPQKWTHSTFLEIVWTLIPALILMAIAIPSFALLFSMDEIIDPAITLKVLGNQWFWKYEYSDYSSLDNFESLSFDSYMIPEEDLVKGGLRLLEVDNRLVLPVNTHVRVLVTSADVLHSWAIPSFGIKIDACPGRLNQTSLFIKREGIFYGQCSEICGVNHGFMPIVVEAVNLDKYINWIANKLEA